MITAYATFETAVKATKLGAYDFLAKPFTPDELRYALRKATEPAHPEQAGAQAGRGEAPDPLQLHLGARARAQGAAQRRRGLPQDPAHHRGRPNLQMIDRSLIRLDGMRKLIIDLLDLTRIESGQSERVVKRWTCASSPRRRSSCSPSRPRAGASPSTRRGDRTDHRRRRRDRDHPQQPRLERGQVQPRRRLGQRRLAPQGDGVTISVTDTGIGLTPEEAGKLFKEFVRIKNEDTARSSAAAWACRRCASSPTSTAAKRR